MDFLASKLLGLFSTCGNVLILALLIGVLLLWLRRDRRAGRTMLTLVMLILIAVVYTPLQPSLTGILENRFPDRPALPDKIDGIIVLGGMIRLSVSEARDRPSLNDAGERLTEAAYLARLHPEAKVLFTGGTPNPWDPAPREASYAALLLRQIGVDQERLVIEDESRNTYENALFSRRMLPARTGEVWVLVTSAIHMPRSVGVFRQTGWTIIPWPVNYLTGGEEEWTSEDVPVARLSRLSRTLHEWVGMIYYRLRGWTPTLFPEKE